MERPHHPRTHGRARAPALPPTRTRPRVPRCRAQLISRLKKFRGGFTEDLAARLLKKMIASILYCHENNVCHRDVKLDNFVYESDDDEACRCPAPPPCG